MEINYRMRETYYIVHTLENSVTYLKISAKRIKEAGKRYQETRLARQIKKTFNPKYTTSTTMAEILSNRMAFAA